MAKYISSATGRHGGNTDFNDIFLKLTSYETRKLGTKNWQNIKNREELENWLTDIGCFKNTEAISKNTHKRILSDGIEDSKEFNRVKEFAIREEKEIGEQQIKQTKEGIEVKTKITYYQSIDDARKNQGVYIKKKKGRWYAYNFKTKKPTTLPDYLKKGEKKSKSQKKK